MTERRPTPQTPIRDDLVRSDLDQSLRAFDHVSRTETPLDRVVQVRSVQPSVDPQEVVSGSDTALPIDHVPGHLQVDDLGHSQGTTDPIQ